MLTNDKKKSKEIFTAQAILGLPKLLVFWEETPENRTNQLRINLKYLITFKSLGGKLPFLPSLPSTQRMKNLLFDRIYCSQVSRSISIVFYIFKPIIFANRFAGVIGNNSVGN